MYVCLFAPLNREAKKKSMLRALRARSTLRACALPRTYALPRWSIATRDRSLCTAAAPEGESSAGTPDELPDEAPPRLLFEGPKSQTVRTMKMVSVGNLSFACISSPLIVISTQIGGAPATGIAMSALLLTFGGGTTGGLMWATKTYVKHIHTIPGRDVLRVVTPTFFGGDRVTEVPWEAVKPIESAHPFATFEADGRLFYLDEVGEFEPAFKARMEEALPGFTLGIPVEEDDPKKPE